MIKLSGVAECGRPSRWVKQQRTVEVTADDGNTVKTYTVTVTRAAPSTDATLSA